MEKPHQPKLLTCFEHSNLLKVLDTLELEPKPKAVMSIYTEAHTNKQGLQRIRDLEGKVYTNVDAIHPKEYVHPRHYR